MKNTVKRYKVSLSQTEFNIEDSINKVFLKRSKTTLCTLIISLVVNLVVRFDFVALGGGGVGEMSVTETLQQILLLVTSLSFAYLAKERCDIKHASVLICAFFGVLFIREMDFWFDKLTHGAWVYPAMGLACCAILYAIQNGRRTLEQLALILASPHMNVLIIGLMLLLVFSRLWGMGSFWQGVMGEHYIRDVKNISEEGLELLAYCIITFSSLSIVLHLTQNIQAIPTSCSKST
ncbi:hypothetical protein [Vibrio splendidus]|uniref:hypothetical protein n=1 Tax=Vibrio splendidus TaxID=29497 RepID=UPI00076A5C89|nr:hypothetical protein [Vibrio splendidus]PHX04454.1 hypothetical protein VSPL_39940 [Vibrio splendidus]